MGDHRSVRAAAARQVMVSAVLLSSLGVMMGSAQTAAPPSAEVQALAEGWAALRQGQLPQAAKIAERVVAEYPRSGAAAAFAVEVDIQRGGTLAGLTIYERWLGSRRVDDPYVLRRIAQAHLARVAATRQHPARLQAAAALAADGVVDARAELAQAAANGGAAETELLASVGDARAVRDLITQLRAPGGSKARIINALVESRSRQAVAPLVELLGDPREEHRAAAAEALGKLGASETIPRLKPLVHDPVFPVRMAAAAALYRLEDYEGVNLLSELLSSEHGTIRLAAAEGLSVRPMGAWHSVVRELTRHDDAIVQLGAARLIAPYEPEVATQVLARLSQSENPAVREEAGRTFVQRLAADFGTLRKYLRSADGVTGVQAAARILELTR